MILIRETWGHMDPTSGYDPLFVELGKSSPSRSIRLNPQSLFDRVGQRLRRAKYQRIGRYCRFQNLRHFTAADKLLKTLRRQPAFRALLSAAENQYVPLFREASPEIRERIWLCVHQPESWWRTNWSDLEALKGLAGVVTLCEGQSQFFRESLGVRVLEIRHGVCLNVFSPAVQSVAAAPTLIFVGQWLRDFHCLADTMQHLWLECPGLTLNCVVPLSGRNRPELKPLLEDERVVWHAGISTEELVELYRSSSLLLMPVLDATANNAVVEAMACGLPVVSTQIGGIPDYVSPDCGVLCPPGDASAHASAVIDLLNDEDRMACMGDCARQYALEHFDWRPIAERLLEGIDRCG